MLHNQVSALRQALGRNGRLETQGSAYRLNIGPGELDVDRFEHLVEEARDLTETDADAAAELLREALAMWRGPPLADLAYESFVQPEIARLEERRWAAFEARVDADLALGRHAEVVGDLEAAVAEEPLRERLRAQLMLALYRSGRQAEALDAYRAARRTLVDEVGVEPGAELRALQEAILAQDPALAVPPRPEELPAALDGGSPLLAGRDQELAELVALLGEACDGNGGVAFIAGPSGIGKTRLAAEVAREASSRGVAILYTGASTTPGDANAAVGRAGRSERPTLLVLDDADGANPDLLNRAAAAARPHLLVLVLHREPEAPSPFARREGARFDLGSLGDEAVAEIARLYRAGGERAASGRGARHRRAEVCPSPCIAWRPSGRRRAPRRASRRAQAARPPGGASFAQRRPTSPEISWRSGPRTSATGSTGARRRRRRARPCARSPGSPPSTRLTPSTSSVASGSWRNWSRGSWARRSSP